MTNTKNSKLMNDLINLDFKNSKEASKAIEIYLKTGKLFNPRNGISVARK